jgi:hypothetical protein
MAYFHKEDPHTSGNGGHPQTRGALTSRVVQDCSMFDRHDGDVLNTYYKARDSLRDSSTHRFDQPSTSNTSFQMQSSEDGNGRSSRQSLQPHYAAQRSKEQVIRDHI